MNGLSCGVRLSVTRWHPIKTAEHIVMLSSPHCCPLCTNVVLVIIIIIIIIIIVINTVNS